ncbi:MAG: HAMP domain-containing histidine kinase [Clostridia bacterium]|nr:HAMP domain-containing histidine kinase [Clostridia bacterium]
MNSSLYKKNFTITAVLLILSFVILGVSVMMLGRGFALRKTQESIALAAQEVSYSAGAFLESDGLTNWNLRLVISTVARSTGNQIFLTDASGYIISTSESSESIGKRLTDDVMLELQTNGSIHEMTTLGNYYNGRQFYVVALPVTGSFGNVAGYVFVGSDCTDILNSWGTVVKIFVLSAAGIMILALVLTFYASKRQAEPLNEMAAAAKRFARGDFSVRVLSDGRQDEIGALTESFNSMAESLEKSDQLRSDFIANVSHELKTPMTTIAGFADGILDGTIAREDQDRYLETISSETKRLNRLVRQMLDMSRMQSVEPAELFSKSFDLSEVIMRTLLTFEAKITGRGLDVDAQIPEESIIVRGDADAYTQVVYNLLDNAVKFSESGSTLGISLWKQDGKAYVSVKNTGEEISPEELPFVFDRFRKTDRSRSRDRDGVGLGLSIVKTILSNHGENVTVTSKNGVTEFIFTAKLK